MPIETQSEQAREDLIKTEQALTGAIRLSAEQLLADVKAGNLSKAHPDEDPEVQVPDDGPENEGGEPEPDIDDVPLPSEESQDEGPMRHEELVQAFSAMPPEQRQAYRAALDEADGAGEGGTEPAPEEGEPEGEPPPDFGKAELTQIRQMLKTEVGALRSEVARLNKAVNVPARPVRQRAATGPSRPALAPQPRALTKAETIKRLTQKARGPLSKANRDLINQFCEGAHVDVSHLLTQDK